MSTDLLSILALIAAIGAIAYAFWQSKKPVTAANVLTAVQSVPSLATELSTVATMFVQANEQRKKEGNITNQQAYQDALNKVRGWFPVEIGLSNDQIIGAVQSAILVASAMTAQTKADKVVAATAPDAPPAAVRPFIERH